MDTYQTERIAISDLVFDPANARKHSRQNLDAIKGSLKRFGQQKPIVIDESSVVIAGNGTLEAAKELGWNEIIVYRSNLKSIDRTAFALADNRTAELAEWDDDVLGELLQGIREEGFPIEEIGFEIPNVDFPPGSEDDQGTLDEKKKVICPACNHEFTP